MGVRFGVNIFYLFIFQLTIHWSDLYFFILFAQCLCVCCNERVRVCAFALKFLIHSIRCSGFEYFKLKIDWEHFINVPNPANWHWNIQHNYWISDFDWKLENNAECTHTHGHEQTEKTVWEYLIVYANTRIHRNTREFGVRIIWRRPFLISALANWMLCCRLSILWTIDKNRGKQFTIFNILRDSLALLALFVALF